MIHLIVRLGKWLENRFPAKLIVTEEKYLALHAELSIIRDTLTDTQLSLNKALERLSVVEQNSVHKEAVQVAIKELDTLKTDYISFKASMGFRPITAEKQAEISAMLNGEAI